MKASRPNKTSPKDDSKILEIKPLEAWIKEKNDQETKFEGFLYKGEINLIVGSPDPNKALFAFWLGIKIAPTVDSVHHFTFSEKDKILSSIKNTTIPNNLYNAFIPGQNDGLCEQISQVVKARLMAPKSNHVLIIDGLYFRRTRNRDNRIKANDLIVSISDLKDELLKKEIILTVVLISDVDAKEKIWESTELRDFPELESKLNFQKFYFARSKSLTHPNHYYVKPLKTNKFINRRILLLELVKEIGNYHFRMKSLDEEKLHLPLSPKDKAKAEIFLIGILGLAAIRQKYWKGIDPLIYPIDSIVAGEQEKYIIEILETIYIQKSVLPFSHIEYLIVNTNISENRFNEVARKYFKSISRKYDLQLNGWNIE